MSLRLRRHPPPVQPGRASDRLPFRATMRLRDLLLGPRGIAPPAVRSSWLVGQVSSEEAAARMAADLARDQLTAELSRADSDDLKALALLAFDLAGAALVIQAHASLNRFWWATAAGLGASACLLVVALWRRWLEPGPEPWKFYEEARGAIEAKQVALVAVELLTQARDHDRRVRAGKARWYTASLLTLVVTVVGSGIYLWQVH